jgi:hypothetical protein
MEKEFIDEGLEIAAKSSLLGSSCILLSGMPKNLAFTVKNKELASS